MGGLHLIPIRLEVRTKEQINMHNNQKMLLSLQKGRFYNKEDIVRVDKEKQLFHFRNGETLEIKHLKGISLKHYVGYPLTEKLYNFL